MPPLGLGVYQSPPGEETYKAVLSALRIGYRHIDTAQFYGNEADVGRWADLAGGLGAWSPSSPAPVPLLVIFLPRLRQQGRGRGRSGFLLLCELGGPSWAGLGVARQAVPMTSEVQA